MGLEAATFIHQLNAAWPIGASDPKAQGDDHLRLIKSTLQATFPNIAGAMTASHTQLNALIALITGAAAPANDVGLSAPAAGAATTFLRSDATFRLSQTIAPTWTQTHIFTKTGHANASAIRLQANDPGISFEDINNAANEKNWFLYSNGTALQCGLLDDAFANNRNAFSFSRTGAALSAISFGNVTDNPPFNFLGTGNLVASGSFITSKAGSAVNTAPVALNGTLPMVYYRDSDGAADRKNARLYMEGGSFILDFQNDAVSQTREAFNFINNNGVGVMSFGNTTDNNQFTFRGTGLFTVGGQYRGPDGTSGAPSHSFTNEGTMGLYRQGAGSMRASINADVFEFIAAASGGARVADFGGTLQNVGFRHVPQNSQSGNYTAVLADSGKHLLHPNGAGAADTFTIPSNASVAYELGTVLTFVNRDSNSVSIAITTDTMTLAGTTSTDTRTLAQNGVATAIKVESTHWLISGTGLS